MSHPARIVGPEDSVEDCLRRMTVYRLRHVVATVEGRAVGIISIAIWSTGLSAQEDTISQLTSYISGDYPG